LNRGRGGGGVEGGGDEVGGKGGMGLGESLKRGAAKIQ
jgi:hypothetical protein